jgi:hypothetical protein
MKGYIKDPNGKYRLVDKNEVLIVQEPETQKLTLEEIEARLRNVESFLFLAGKK